MMSIDGNRYRYFGINESKKTKLLAYEYNIFQTSDNLTLNESDVQLLYAESDEQKIVTNVTQHYDL